MTAPAARCTACPAAAAHPCGGGLYCVWAVDPDPNKRLHVRNVARLKAEPPPPPWASSAPPPVASLPPVLPEPVGAWLDRIRTCPYREPAGARCGCQAAWCHAGRGLAGWVGDRDCYECLSETGNRSGLVNP